MTREQIEARIAELRSEIANAPRWGAAISARLEEINGLKQKLMQPKGVSPMREAIARAIYDVENRWIAPNFPEGHKFRTFEELDDREQRLHFDYADAVMALQAPAALVDRPREISAAGAIIDIMTGGNFDWRARIDQSDFLESSDWQTALAYARAAIALSHPLNEAQTAATRPAAFLSWAAHTFGAVALDRQERALRFLEEALETAHAEGIEQIIADRILGRVWSKVPNPADTPREIGQAYACLEMYAESIGVSADEEATKEFERVKTFPKEVLVERHKAKIVLGIALPRPEDGT